MPKLLSFLTGGSIGLVFGFIAGWSLFNPESNVWLLFGAVGCMLGVYIGSSSAFHYWVAPIGVASIGLVGGWITSLWLFGEHIGGVGALIMGGGAAIGWKIGSHELLHSSNTALGTLLCIIHFGFGFLVSYIAIWKILIRTEMPNIPLMLIGYIFFCTLGGTLGAQIVQRNRLVFSTNDQEV
jgi:hypothetical protein